MHEEKCRKREMKQRSWMKIRKENKIPGRHNKNNRIPKRKEKFQYNVWKNQEKKRKENRMKGNTHTKSYYK